MRGDPRPPPDSSSERRSWSEIGHALHHVFQPIVQMRTGRCHGFEALVRGWTTLGFTSPMDLFDAAARDGQLEQLEDTLMTNALKTFEARRGTTGAKLFLNVDARLPGASERVAALGMASPVQIVHELSEQDSSAIGERLENAVALYRRSGVAIALDDFGVGFGGLKLLYDARPDYVKIDRFFINGIERDMRKRAIVGYLVSYAHALGVTTIAEGIETKAQFYMCRDLGCDFAQGYLLAVPQMYDGGLTETCEAVVTLNQEDRRRPDTSRERVSELLERVPPLSTDAPRSVLLDLFGDSSAPAVVPVVAPGGMPKGLIRERDLKPFVYSRYGAELLRNRAYGSRLDDFIVPCAICDINTPIERVIEAFSEDSSADGVIIVEGGEYVGLLGSHALLRLVHERRLAAAADQNPLTRLPGNTAITEYVTGVLGDPSRTHLIAYFDFDNFKPFNDINGFRTGDRAILMFSERLKVLASTHGGFAGHVGGDDFVMVVSGVGEDIALEQLAELLTRFRLDAESLYPPEARERGWYEAKDRQGILRHMPLLAASAVALFVTPDPDGNNGDRSIEAIIRLVAEHKSNAKQAASKVAVLHI